MAQLHDKVVGIIKPKLSEGERKYKCFRLDHKGVLLFESRLVVPKNHELRKQILTKHTSLNSQSIQVAPKCTRTSGKISGGPE